MYQSGVDPKTKRDVWMISASGNGTPIPIAQTEFNESDGVFSPDGKWAAYASDETGKSEIYARPVDNPAGKIKITANGGRKPLWRADGREIFFSSLDRKLQVARVKVTASGLTVDSIGTLFDFNALNIPLNTVEDVDKDGKRILVLVSLSHETSIPITLVENWDEELRKK
jgi:Tol biopolymer transport system component